MSDVLVCAEPETREEAAQFVSKLGARLQICSIRNLKQRREKWHWMLVYLKGTEPSATLRTCLRQVSGDSSLHVIVYTHPDDGHQTAELGRVIGEFRPRGTDICFYEREVEKILHAGMSLAGKEKPVSRDTLAALRKDLDLTQVDLAAGLDVTPRTVQNREKHGRGPKRRYRDLKELHGLLSKYIESGQVASWMDSANEAFRNHAA